METRVEVMRVHNGSGSSITILTGIVIILDIVPSEPSIPYVVVYTCEKCGEPNFLTPHACS